MAKRGTRGAAAAEVLEPRTLMAAQAYEWNSVTIKANGFIDGIVYGPAGSNRAYIHTDMGGAYRWDTAANRWQPMTDWAKYNDAAAKHMGVETMAADPTDANRVYMAVGTYMSPTAIMRSADGGVTWARTDVSFNSNGNGSARNAGERMAVDPNAPNILYYGTRDDGLWKSTDYGATWAQAPAFPTIGQDSGFLADTGIVWVTFDKASGTAGAATPTIYAGVVASAAGTARIYRSTDAGVSWAPLPGTQYADANAFPQRAALTPDGSALYLTYSSSTTYPGPYGVGTGRVIKVTNPRTASPTWQNVTPVGWAGGASGIELDPTDPNTVYATELGNYNPADRIWRTTNGGANWSVMNPNSNRDDSSAPYVSGFGIHWMGDVQIDPANRNVAMFTTGYGLYRTTNLTAAQPTWTFFNDGFEQSAVLEFATPNDGGVRLISAIGDRDGYRHVDFSASPAAGLGRANGITMGTSPDIDVAFNDSRYLVRVGNANNLAQYSLDNGVNWAYFGTKPANSTGGGNIAISADGARAVWDPEGTAPVTYAVRTGSTWGAWQAATADVGTMNGATVVADLVDPMTFYAYAGTTVWRSTNGGAGWTRLTTTAGINGPRDVRATPGAKGHLWADSFNDGLWRSTNGGATWARVSQATVTTAYTLGVGAPAPDKSYASIYVTGTVGGVVGFFRSDDQGATWTHINDDAHHYGQLTVIQADPRVFGRLYLGTNGRGILYGDIRGGAPATPAPPSMPAVTNVQSASLTLSWLDLSADETGFRVERSADGVTWTQIATPAANATSHQVTGLSPGVQYYLRVRAANAAGGSAYTSVAIAQTTAGALPAGYTGGDVGAPAPAGSSGYTGGTFTLTGGGADVWGTADQFHYVSTDAGGDFAVIARVTGQQNTDPWAKAGVMVRNGTAANAAHASVFQTPGNGVAFQWRATAGGTSGSATVAGVTNAWVKLIRSGNAFAAYYSTNGTAWTKIGATQTVAMPPAVKAGLAVTSHNTAAASTATFTNVSIVPAPTVTARQVNDGAAQRSKVTSLSYTFSAAVTLQAGAFTLVRRSDGLSVGLLASNPSGDRRTFVLTFTGSSIVGGSLADGVYDLTVVATAVVDDAGQTLTGGNNVLTFHRLFGDSDGDRDVDNLDALRFRQAQGTLAADAAYRPYFDFDADNDVDNLDALRFRQRQGTVYSY